MHRYVIHCVHLLRGVIPRPPRFPAEVTSIKGSKSRTVYRSSVYYGTKMEIGTCRFTSTPLKTARNIAIGIYSELKTIGK